MSLVILTILISASQLFFLYFLGYFEKLRNNPLSRILITPIISLALLICVLSKFEYNFIEFFPSLLFFLSSYIALFTAWSLINWGVTTEMLVSLNKKKIIKDETDFVNAIIKPQKKNSLEVFCNDRLNILVKTNNCYIIKSKVYKKKISFFYNFIIKILDSFYGLKK